MVAGMNIGTNENISHTDTSPTPVDLQMPNELIPPPVDWCTCPRCKDAWDIVADIETTREGGEPDNADAESSETTYDPEQQDGPRKQALAYRESGGPPRYSRVTFGGEYITIGGGGHITSDHFGGTPLVTATTISSDSAPFVVPFRPETTRQDLSFANLSRILHATGATIEGRTQSGYATNTPTNRMFPRLKRRFPERHAIHETPISAIETVEKLQDHLYIEYSLLLATMNGKLPKEVLSFLYKKIAHGITKDDLNQVLTAIKSKMPDQRGQHLHLLRAELEDDQRVDTIRELLLIPNDHIGLRERQQMITSIFYRSRIKPELRPLLEEIVDEVRSTLKQAPQGLIHPLDIATIREYINREINTQIDNLSYDLEVDTCVCMTLVGSISTGKTTALYIINNAISYAQKHLSGRPPLRCHTRDLEPYAPVVTLNALAKSKHLSRVEYLKRRAARQKMGNDLYDFDPPFIVYRMLSQMGLADELETDTIRFLQMRRPNLFVGSAGGPGKNQRVTSMGATTILHSDVAIHLRVPDASKTQYEEERNFESQIRDLAPTGQIATINNPCYGHNRFIPPYIYEYLDQLRNPTQDPAINHLVSAILSIAEETLARKEIQLRKVAQSLFTHLLTTHDTPTDTGGKRLFLKLDDRTRSLMTQISDDGMPRIIVNPKIRDGLEQLWYWVAEQV